MKTINTSPLGLLDAQQQNAVVCEDPLQVIVAGPGSGKTRTLVEKVAYIAQQDTRARIVVVTFTNAAAREIEERLANRCGSVQLAYCGTIHGLMLQLLNKFGPELGICNAPLTVMNKEQADELLMAQMKTLRYTGTELAVRTRLAAGPPPKKMIYSKEEAVVLSYFNCLQESGLIDYDGLLIYGLKLLELMGNREGYTHLLHDECQDSGEMDFAILEALTIPTRVHVGDSNQAIYGFRNGSVRHLHTLENRGTVNLLTGNYRSGSEICKVATDLIKHNPERLHKTMQSKRDFPGVVESWGPFETDGYELQSIGNDIRRMESGLAGLPDGEAALSVAVLVRTNFLANLMANCLVQLGFVLAHRDREEAMPQDWAAAKLLVAILQAPDNDLLVHRYLCKMRNEKEADAMRYQAADQLRSINQALRLFPTGLGVREILNRLGREGISSDTIELVRPLVANLRPDATLTDLVLAMSRPQIEPKPATQGITVSTMHGSKGMEFDTVYLPAFEDEIIPAGKGSEEEERRLAFVAITRAKRRLVFSSAKVRKRHAWMKEAEPATPSRFLKEALQTTTK